MEEKGEGLKKHHLPVWRQVKIAEKVCLLFAEMLQDGSEDILRRTMIKLGIVPIPYSQISKNKKDVRELLGEYGFIFQPVKGMRLFFFNEEQSDAELRKTSWHEVGHVELEHTQASALAEAEADFFMECAALLENNIEKLREVMPMICETKSA